MTRRLVVSYLAITLIVLLLLELPLAIFYQQRELDRLTVDIERDATVLATIYEEALEENLIADPLPAQDYHDDTGARVVIVDPAGTSVIDTELEPGRDYSTRPELAEALTGLRSSGTRRSDTLNTDLLFVAVPVASGGEVFGALRITFDAHEVTERIWRFWTGLIAVGVVVLVVMAGVGLLLARSVTRPVRELQAAAARFSGGDLTAGTIGTGAPPELADLNRSMNRMAARLDEMIEQQRAFVADASHQLRTPLTALRLRLENLQSSADEADASELGDAIDETNRLSTLVSDLLRLARTERSPELVDTELARLLADRVDVWGAVAEQEGVVIELVGPGRSVRGRTVAGGLEQVIDNLLDNAIRVAPHGSTITLTLVAGTEVHTLSVADVGPGLSDDDKRLAMKRFWRGDHSTPGTGLGLAIARAIVESAGGSLELRDNTPHGLVAEIGVVAV